MADSKYAVVKAWRKKNKDKVAAQARRYRGKHPDKRRAITDRYREANLDKIRETDKLAQRRRRVADPEKNRICQQRFKAKREARLVGIAGRPRPSICDLCKQNNGGIVFDHCHVKGHFRGWLCDRCNRVLGLVYDNPKLLKMMARYLEGSNGAVNGEAKEQVAGGFFCWAGEVLSN